MYGVIKSPAQSAHRSAIDGLDALYEHVPEQDISLQVAQICKWRRQPARRERFRV